MPPSYNDDLKIGDRIAGHYEILAVLGHGSMGVVYKCRHDILGRIVAIKTLRLQRTADDRSQRRFEREARLTSRLDHPNLISVKEFGDTANGDPYLVMDFVSGEPLFDILKRERTIYPERVINLFAQVCDGLYHAHQRGVIHRDLKPANMLVVQRENAPETVKIVDLGVAKIVQGGEEEEAEAITMTGEVCGSPIYLSPEQCMYQELDARTDIYSLGVCLYECLTGMAPLRGNTVYDTIYMHVHDMPRPFSLVAPHLEIPKRLEEIVFKCLAKQPKDRYETMMQVKHDLLSALKSSNSPPSVNVLPPEMLFSGQNSAAMKNSGEQVKPTRKVSSEMPKPTRKVSSELAKPTRKSSGNVSNQGEPSPYGQGAAYSEPKGTPVAGRSRRSASQPQGQVAAAEPKRPRSRQGKSDSKPALLDPAVALSSPGIGKWVVIGACASIVVGLSIGFGFAAFLSMNKTNTATPSQLAALPGQEIQTAPAGQLPADPFGPGNASTPSQTIQKPQGKSSATTKPGKNGAGGKKGQKQTQPAPHKDLESFLPEEHLQDGSQSKFFSGFDMPKNNSNQHGQAQQQPMMPSGARPLGQRSNFALNSLVNKIPKGGMAAFKNFIASQSGGGMPGGASQSGSAPGNGLFPGGIPAQHPAQPTKFTSFAHGNQSQQPAHQGNGLQNNGEWLQPGQAERPDNKQQAENIKNDAVQLYMNKQYERSAKKFEEAYALDSSDIVRKGYATALNAYANQLNLEGHYAEAVETSRRAVNLTPDNPIIQKNAHIFSENLDAQRAGTLR